MSGLTMVVLDRVSCRWLGNFRTLLLTLHPGQKIPSHISDQFVMTTVRLIVSGNGSDDTEEWQSMLDILCLKPTQSPHPHNILEGRELGEAIALQERPSL
jgi:hypothetical protein